jgi:serine/threonine protein kinase
MSTPQQTTQAKLADYNMEKRIGKGQFSTVYKGTRVADGLVVAIKKIPVINIYLLQVR